MVVESSCLQCSVPLRLPIEQLQNAAVPVNRMQCGQCGHAGGEVVQARGADARADHGERKVTRYGHIAVIAAVIVGSVAAYHSEAEREGRKSEVGHHRILGLLGAKGETTEHELGKPDDGG